ncbi:hypothetical protein BKN38_07050 [Helicobacter sp. CLO-3]|nr:hypothetical protein BA723_04615 [Helicobacter sp. CLO-3]OHU82411.1 hypothetical protein BKN38_07050 [Helicobacter sp. CLO-3]
MSFCIFVSRHFIYLIVDFYDLVASQQQNHSCDKATTKRQRHSDKTPQQNRTKHRVDSAFLGIFCISCKKISNFFTIYRTLSQKVIKSRTIFINSIQNAPKRK